jgi:hypothetical protein
VQAELEAAVRELLWGSEPATDAGEWLAAELDGWLLSRELAREKLSSALALMLERTAAALGPRFERDVSAFLAERGAGERQLHRVAASFVEQAAPRWQRDASLPSYSSELARHEVLELELAAHAEPASAATELPLALDAGLAFAPTCRIVRYEHALHRTDDDCSEPERRSTTLLVFRDTEHDVRCRELAPAEALLLQGLLAGLSLGACVGDVQRQIRDEGSLVLQCARVLAELAEQGAIVGPCAAVD